MQHTGPLELLTDDTRAAAESLERLAVDSAAPEMLAAAAIRASLLPHVAAHLRPATLLDRAESVAVTTRDRQVVALARAHLEGGRDRLTALLREHLADHPDSVVAVWLSQRHDSDHPATAS
jgi:hypothetical protein